MLLGSLTAGPIANQIGRKWTSIIGTCLTLALSYSLIPIANKLWIIHLSRFLMGAGLGVSVTMSTLYIMEIAVPSMRSALAVVPAVAGTLGVLLCQCLGAIMSWKMICILLALINVPFFVMLLLIPETPVYLIATQQIDRAHRTLRILRGKHWDVTKELTELKCASDGMEKHRINYRDFLTLPVLKPFSIALCLMFFFQFSGINLILFYTVSIFKSAESSINEFVANIFVGLALLASNILTLIIANKMPRRLMLLLSALGISFILIAMGVYFYLKESDCSQDDFNCYDMSQVRWLPLILLMIYIFVFSLGYGAMIWITVAEILPMKIRSVANSISVAFTCLCSFLTSHTYPSLKENLGNASVFGLYGGISLIGFIFILIFVPETKGKTEAEIRDYFAKTKPENTTEKSDQVI